MQSVFFSDLKILFDWHASRKIINPCFNTMIFIENEIMKLIKPHKLRKNSKVYILSEQQVQSLLDKLLTEETKKKRL